MHKIDARQDPADGAEGPSVQPSAGDGQAIIIDRQIVRDAWHLMLADETDVPASGPVIVPLALWQARRDSLRQRAEPVGVWLAPHEEVEALADDLASLPLIAVSFPVFTDGRGFSTGRLLRERYGFKGELRAIGDVFKDTLYYLKRCGFNAFAVRPDKNIEDALLGLDDFTQFYQGAVDDAAPLFRRRAI